MLSNEACQHFVSILFLAFCVTADPIDFHAAYGKSNSCCGEAKATTISTSCSLLAMVDHVSQWSRMEIEDSQQHMWIMWWGKYGYEHTSTVIIVVSEIKGPSLIINLEGSGEWVKLCEKRMVIATWVMKGNSLLHKKQLLFFLVDKSRSGGGWLFSLESKWAPWSFL